MFERTPNALFYLGLIGFSLLFSAADLFLNAPYARSRGFSKWKNNLAPQTVVFAANGALVLYPFSTLPTLFANTLTVPTDESFFVLCIAHVFWFMASKGMFFFRVLVSAGAPRSFIAYLFSRSDQGARENIRANQYAVMGTFGSAAGPVIMSQSFGVTPSGQGSGIMLIVFCGLASWFALWFTRRVFRAPKM